MTYVYHVAQFAQLSGSLAPLEECFCLLVKYGIEGNENVTVQDTEVGSMIYAVKPGDGSAREQAASCQRVIGGLANICKEYATKRYRSNVMNWGMVPFQMEEAPCFEVGDYIYVPGVRKALDGDLKDIKAYVLGKEGILPLFRHYEVYLLSQ